MSASGHLVPSLAHRGKTYKICRISAVVAPIGLKFCVSARFLVSRLLGPFPAHFEHLLYYEVGLDDVDLCYALS